MLKHTLLPVFVAGLVACAGTCSLIADDAIPTLPDSPAAPATPIDATPAAPTGNFIAPVPVGTGNSWQGGWSGAYHPGYYYWSATPNYTYATNHVPGYAPGLATSSWNGYWNYATAYGAPGWTGYWHGWYAGPHYGYGPYSVGYGYGESSAPSYSYESWGYSTNNWGHGYWHRPAVHSPRRIRHR